MDINRVRLRSAKIEFLAGTDFKEAAEFMYNLHLLTGGDITTTFNGVLITVVNEELHEKLKAINGGGK